MGSLMEVKNLTKSFGGLVAVNDLSFELEETGVHALIGPNGSGKTTTINLISGMLPANEGSIQFDGKELNGMKPHQIARVGLRRTHQNIKLFSTMSILENVMVGAHMDTNAGIIRTLLDFKTYINEEKMLKERAEEVLELVGLYDRRNEIVGSQPYGVQKLTELGVGMVSKPKLLLLDEPAAGLTPSERTEFIDMVLKIFDMGVKVLIVEHNMDVVMNISKKITVLNFGSKIAEGSPFDIQNNDDVIKAYLGRKFKKAT